MARVLVPINMIGRGSSKLLTNGITPVNGDAVNGHYVPNDGRTFVRVKNASVDTTRVVTMLTRVSVDSGIAAATDPEDIEAGVEAWFGPYPTNIYGTSLQINVAHADLKLTAFRLPSA